MPQLRQRSRVHLGVSNRSAASSSEREGSGDKSPCPSVPTDTESGSSESGAAKSDDDSVKTSRKRQTATWAQTLASSARHWQSEHRDEIGVPRRRPKNHSFLDEVATKNAHGREVEDSILLDRAIGTLQQLLVLKYGSVRNFFHTFDADHNGKISLHEFSMTFKIRNLERVIPRRDQRLIFERLDTDHSGHLDLEEFKNALMKPTSYSQPLDKIQEHLRQIGIKMRAISPKAERIRDALLQKITQKLRLSKEADSVERKTAYLLNAFRQMDSEMSGFLSPQEFAASLGPEGLNICADPKDLQEVFEAMDVNKDARISYGEFINFLAVHDIDPEYNPFYDGRRSYLLSLDKTAHAPWHFWKETEGAKEAFAKYKKLLDDDREAAEEANAKEEARLKKREEALQRHGKKKDACADAASETLQGDPEVSSIDSYEKVFEDMRETRRMQMSQTCPRIVAPPPTDWSRVGLGGNGTRSTSALYARPRDRMVTTSSLYFSPFTSSESQRLSRARPSDASLAAQSKAKKIKARAARRSWNLQRIQDRLAYEEALKVMSKQQTLRIKAKAMHDYYRTAYERDAYIEKRMPPERMQRRAQHSMSKQILGVSPESQFQDLRGRLPNLAHSRTFSQLHDHEEALQATV